MPTLDLQVDASADDAYEQESDGVTNTTLDRLRVISGTSARYWGGLRFHGALPAVGSTITVAYIEVYLYSTSYDDANFDIHAEPLAAPPAFTTGTNNITARTRTTASASWVGDTLGTGWKTSPSIVSVIQELVDSLTPTAIILILKPKTNTGKIMNLRSWDEASNVLGAKLHLEWTEGGAAPQTINATPVAAPLVVPAPTVTPGASTITASPIAITTQLPTATLIAAAAPHTLSPDPVVVTLALPSPTLNYTLNPADGPIALVISVVEPGVTPGAWTIAASPVALTLTVPTQTLSTATGAAFIPFGNITRLIDRSDFATDALFYFEAVLQSSTPAVTAKAYLYNITDGSIVAGSEVTTTSVTATRLRSAAITLSGAKEYRAEFGGDAGGIYNCYAADVIVDSN